METQHGQEEVTGIERIERSRCKVVSGLYEFTSEEVGGTAI